MSVSSGLPFLVGPFLGGRLASPAVVSWFKITTPFYVVALIFIMVGVVLIFVLNETNVCYEKKLKYPYSSVLEVLLK